jgi:hypothetical protein
MTAQFRLTQPAIQDIEQIVLFENKLTGILLKNY